MNSVTLKLDQSYGNYSYQHATNIAMNILGNFLAGDVGNRILPFKSWGLKEVEMDISGNLTSITRENGYVILTDIYSEEAMPTECKMTTEQFVQLLDDWDQKVCKLKPKEVITKYENNQFSIETRN